jgi:hypothetical protein
MPVEYVYGIIGVFFITSLAAYAWMMTARDRLITNIRKQQKESADIMAQAVEVNRRSTELIDRQDRLWDRIEALVKRLEEKTG